MDIKKVFRIFLLLITVCCQPLTAHTSDRVGIPEAKDGILDLRKYSFNQEIALNGEWKFYWLKLVNPKTAAETGVKARFPFRWDGYNMNGVKLPSFGYASYRLRVLLPETTEQLQLAMPDVYSAYTLFINGEEVLSNGQVSDNPAKFIPHWQYKAVDIEQGTDTLDLVLYIANFVHSKGGVKKPILLGQKMHLESERQQAEAIDLVLTGCLFMGGLFFLGLYVLSNRDNAILLFSLYSIVYSYRIAGIDNYVLHSVFPDISWYLTVRLEYCTLFFGIGLFGLYTKFLYPNQMNKYLAAIIITICFGFAIISLVTPPLIFTRLINPFLLVMVFCIVYIPYVYIAAYRARRPGAAYALASSVALMSIFTISLLHYWTIIPQLQLVSFAGYISFFFLQSLVLSHRVSYILKEARQQAETGLKVKTDFLSTMSHEIRTPLNSVIGMSHLMLKNNPREDQVKQLDVLLFSANHLLSIVNDILDYNKIEAGMAKFEYVEMDIISLAENVLSGLQIQAQRKGISLTAKLDSRISFKLIGDPTRTSQVITNLVHNAIKFTKEGGVELRVDLEEETETAVWLRVSVADTGIGISPDHQHIIFDRFTQADSSTSRSFGGTGLGLSICKRILELQGAKLEVSSEEGRGSVFYFRQRFDRGSNAAAQPPAVELRKERSLAGVEILLVEDNPLNVKVAQGFLSSWGAHVDLAVNGKEALDLVDPGKHKVVLMDLHMPVMDGYQSAREMRSRGVNIPIIALTANLPDEIKDQIVMSGINDVVVKPFLPEILLSMITRYVRK
ncbi:ATP-binding protein [Pedobacter deserti]|uniref:ATP-binding protein n=1 Tax=Pedobacter deserti TaxID=2817382 RepID=UPI00210A3660|nr:ATP-binding protein [Pedobacter sp. SYSU D00382]